MGTVAVASRRVWICDLGFVPSYGIWDMTKLTRHVMGLGFDPVNRWIRPLLALLISAFSHFSVQYSICLCTSLSVHWTRPSLSTFVVFISLPFIDRYPFFFIWIDAGLFFISAVFIFLWCHLALGVAHVKDDVANTVCSWVLAVFNAFHPRSMTFNAIWKPLAALE